MTRNETALRRESRRQFVRRALSGGMGATLAVAGGSSAPAAQLVGPIRAFDHVAIPMRDTEAMLPFYRALGFVVMEGVSSRAAVWRFMSCLGRYSGGAPHDPGRRRRRGHHRAGGADWRTRRWRGERYEPLHA